MKSRIHILILCVLLAFSSMPLNAQNTLEQILNSDNYYADIIKEADAFFSQQYPGKSAHDLSSGPHRDGNFVKYQRWKNYWKNRLNPDGTLGDPTKIFRSAILKNNLNDDFKDIQWSNIGLPGNLGGQIGVGRTTSIAFHPTDKDIFLVSTAMGGVWKTLDGGSSYIPIGDNLPTLAVSVVVVDPKDPDIIYAATGDRVWYGLHGIGIYKSTNGGDDWKETALNWNFADLDRIYAIAIDPTNTSKLYVASDKGLFLTEDGFETYEHINNEKAYDVKLKPDDPSVVYFTAGKGFWKSKDAGLSFAPTHSVSSVEMMRISVSRDDPDRVYFSNKETLYQSFDAGETFVESKNIGSLDNGSLGYVIMSDFNADRLYGGYFETWKSINNGLNWNKITCFSGGQDIHVDNHFATSNPLDPGFIYFCNDGGLYKLKENNCNSCSICFNQYIDLSAGMRISQYYDISHSQQSYNLISGGTQDNGSFFRNKSGAWQFYAPTGDGMVGAIDPTNDNHQYWTYQNGTINLFSDGNNECISCNIPNDEDGNGEWVTPFVLDPNKPSVIVAGYKRIYYSANKGRFWRDISGELAPGELFDHIAIAVSNSNVIYAMQRNTLFATKKGLSSTSSDWTQKRLPRGQITSLAVDPYNEDEIYYTLGGFFDGDKVFYSKDAGKTWENISGRLPNVPVNVIKTVRDSLYSKALFIGTDAGVFYRDDTLNDWVEYGQLPHTQVSDLEIQYNNQLVRIGTHGRSIFEAPMPNNPCMKLNPPDTDGDGVCDSFDACPLGDDFKDLDGDGLPDDCEVYCLASGSAGTGDDYINLVELNTLSKSSSKSAYSSFTDFSTDLYVGERYTLNIGLNFSFDLDKAYAWIDFNQDKEFTNDERIFMSPFNQSHISSGNFSVPDDALNGLTTLRVRNIYADRPIVSPCDSYFGEVEDYSVNIIGSLTDVTNLEENTIFHIYPNPIREQLTLKFSDFSRNLQVNIVNVNGEMIWRKKLNGQEFKNDLVIDTSNWPAGVYFVRVKSTAFQAVEKMIKIN